VEIAHSVNRVPIRLTEERWRHIVGNRPYLASRQQAVLEAIEHPSLILRGYRGSLIAVLNLARRRYLHVVYREVSQDDGFIITAFIAHRYNRGAIVWKQSS